jgi:hypothetical protein
VRHARPDTDSRRAAPQALGDGAEIDRLDPRDASRTPRRWPA